MTIFDTCNTNEVIQKLDAPILVGGKYQCRFYIKCDDNVTIYFTNITDVMDISCFEFTLVKRIKFGGQDLYILAPDTTSPKRGSYLLIHTYGTHSDEEYIGIKQRALFEFFVHIKASRKIIALSRDYPEIYTVEHDVLFALYYNQKKDSTRMYRESFLYTGEMLSNMVQKDDSITDFVMLSERMQMDHMGKDPIMHPKTRFVIDSNNTFFIHPLGGETIANQFLNLDSIPSGVSMLWLFPEDAIETAREIHQLDPKNLYRKVIIIGYDYETTHWIRAALHGINCESECL